MKFLRVVNPTQIKTPREVSIEAAENLVDPASKNIKGESITAKAKEDPASRLSEHHEARSAIENSLGW